MLFRDKARSYRCFFLFLRSLSNYRHEIMVFVVLFPISADFMRYSIIKHGKTDVSSRFRGVYKNIITETWYSWCSSLFLRIFYVIP